MKKRFLKPFAATVGSMLVASTANAAVTPVDLQSAAIVARSADNLAGANVTLQHATGSVELAAHGSHASHSSHASHASHASHSSHASSSY
jgi:hypothetical protein